MCWKVDNRKGKIFETKENFRKMCYTNFGEKRRLWRTIQFSLHMQSGSLQRSLGDSINFFSFQWWEMASASRQGQRMKTQIIKKKKKEVKEDTKKQETGEKKEKRWKERRRVKTETCEQRK